MSETFRALGIAGSLRAASFNRALLRAATELAPARLQITIYEELGRIPPYNADDDDAGPPAAVRSLKNAIETADALLIASPEYNYGIPGVLKNAIDWASRPSMKSVLAGKPVALMGASNSLIGTARAQAQLRDVLASTISHVLPPPEVLVGRAREKFDSEGRLTDEASRTVLTGMLARFVEWIPRFRQAE